MNFGIIEDAFLFVSSAPYCENEAYLNRATGKTFYVSAMAGTNDLPAGAEDDENVIPIPHKRDLDLGQPLVWEFVSERCPAEEGKIRAIFARKGAYRRYKDYLNEKGLIEEWYAFEDVRTKKALLEWCRENEIELNDDGGNNP